jgi:hypothetical protein
MLHIEVFGGGKGGGGGGPFSNNMTRSQLLEGLKCESKLKTTKE